MGYYKGCDHCSEGMDRPTPREALIDKVQRCPYCGKENEVDGNEGIEQFVELFEELTEKKG